jgi:hypothetical protein
MDWERRDKVFLAGAPLAMVPAAAFLPLFAYLVIAPQLVGASPWSAAMIATLVFVQMLGSVLVGFAAYRGGFSYVTLLAVATVGLLLAVAAYTGFFCAAFAFKM